MKREVDRLKRRDELFAEWKATDPADHGTLSRICVELNGLFDLRKDWQRKHKPSYNYAIHRLLIPNRRTDKAPRMVIDINLSAKARDDLHGFCQMHYAPYAVEHAAGEVLKAQIAGGNSYEAALELAKRVAIDGIR